MPVPRGFKHSQETIEKMKVDGRRGRRHTEESKIKMSEWQKGKHHSPATEVKKGQHLSLSTEFKKGYKPSETTRHNWSEMRRATGNPNWKGGVTPLHLMLRASHEYKLWRTAVFERDNYTCVWCKIKGNETGGYLEADHIKPFSIYPKLRFVIDNGRTLCVNCHRKTDTHGRRRK